jgi:PAS domain S-box-containing protein
MMPASNAPASVSQINLPALFSKKVLELSNNLFHVHQCTDWQLSYISPQIESVLGFSAEAFQEAGSFTGIATDQEKEHLIQKLVQVCSLPEGSSLSFENYLLDRSGKRRKFFHRFQVYNRKEDGTASEIIGISQDITQEEDLLVEKHKSQALLEETEKTFRSGSWIINLQSQRVVWSKGLWQLLGVPEKDIAAQEALQAGDLEYYYRYVHPEDVAIVREKTSLIFEEGRVMAYDHRIINRQGEIRTVYLKGKWLEEGGQVRVIGSITDVTEEREAARRLEESLTLLSQSEKTFQYGSWIWHLATDEVVWSEGMMQLFGYSPDEFSSQVRTVNFYFEHIHPEDQEELMAFIKKQVYERANPINGALFVTQQHRIRTAQGEERCVEGRGKLIVEKGQIVKVLGSTTEVTNQRAAYTRLFRSEMLMTESERLLQYGSWEWAPDTDTLHWSEGLWKVFGFAPGAFPLSFETYMERIHPADKQHLVETIQQTQESGNEFEVEHRFIRADGEVRYMAGRGKVYRDAKGHILRMQGSAADVTRLRQYEFELEQKIRDLNRSNQELEQFAYVASHDLQEPLRKIIAFGDRLEMRCGSLLNEEGKQYLSRMSDSARRMKLLIENLLNFSRLTRKNQPLEPTDLNEVLQAVLIDLEVKIQEKQAQFRADQLPIIAGIASQIHQVFLNLIGNALKFSKPDQIPQVAIRYALADPQLVQQQGLDSSRPYHCILISDNGIGFEQEYAERIFFIFQRLHGRMEYEGSGIGLAICKKIAENHNGQIFAQSSPGEGATFGLLLPVVALLPSYDR